MSTLIRRRPVASEISLVAAGDISALTLQAAVMELDTEKASLAGLAASNGSGLIGHQPVTGPPTTTQTRLRAIDLKTVSVQDFVTGGLGTSASPWTGWDTAIVWAERKQYDFLDGYYSYVTSPNFGKNFLRLNGRRGTVIRHTGAGYGMVFDAGAAVTFIIDLDVKNIRLECNAASTGGSYARGVTRSSLDLTYHNVPGVCHTDIFSVLNNTTLKHTGLIDGITIIPTNLLAINKRDAAELSSANTYNLVAEGCSATGVVLNDCINSSFIGGTSELNGAGYFISPTSSHNTFLNSDCEGNATSDITCNGTFNTFIGGVSLSSTAINGSSNAVIRGSYNTLTSGGSKNTFDGVAYGNNSGTFTDSGTETVTRSLLNIVTGLVRLDTPVQVEKIRTARGVTAPLVSGVATTIFTAEIGRTEVVAYLSVGDAVNYAACATVLVEGNNTAARIIGNNGGLLTLTLSGKSVQVTQSAGSPQVVNFSFLRIQ